MRPRRLGAVFATASVPHRRLGRHGLARHRGESLDHAREQRFRYVGAVLPGLLLSRHVTLRTATKGQTSLKIHRGQAHRLLLISLVCH